jgi:WD40 repeat protein
VGWTEADVVGNRTCSRCGSALHDSSVDGYCLNCLLREGLDDPGGAKPPDAGRRFGNYELLERIGQGGMGMVFRARQLSLDRIVAIKLLPFSRVSSEAAVRRFQTEASAAASLQHPNIVAIHEVGEHEGQHYFSMDLIEGRTLAEIVREQPLPAKRAASYLKTIAEAVHCAHEHGILHRDLKPSNILIDATDQPRVTDFGLAKRLVGSTDHGPQTADLTLSGQVLGSPNFMAPEQAAGRHEGVGPRTDVYALGAILYQLVTRQPPFQADTLTTLLKQVVEAEPVSPRLLNPSLPRDLETICLKCLEKVPSRRYPTAQTLAEDLRRFLESEPIHARPVHAVAKAWKWCRRRPTLAGMTAALALTFVVGFAGVLWQWRRATAGRDEAVVARVHSDRERYDADMAAAQMLIEQRHFDRAQWKLLAVGESHRNWEWGWLERQCHRDLMTLSAGDETVHTVAFSPDSRLLATGDEKSVRVWDLATGATKFFFGHDYGAIHSTRFSSDGTRLLTACVDRTARVWDASSAQQLLVLAHGDYVVQAVFSPDDRIIATAGGHHGLKLWDAQSGALLPSPEHGESVYAVAFSRDGRWLAYAGGEGWRAGWRSRWGAEHYGTPWRSDREQPATVSLFNRLSGERRVFSAHRRAIVSLDFSPDGELLASASWDGTARLWSTSNCEEVRPLQLGSDAGVLFKACFSPDGRRLAVGGALEGTVGYGGSSALVLDVSTGQRVRTLDHPQVIGDVCFSPDGKLLATGCHDGNARVWAVSEVREYLSLEGHDQPVWALSYSRDGRRLTSGSLDGTARIWNAEGALITRIEAGAPVVCVAFSPDGERVVTGAPSHCAKAWNATNGSVLLTLSGHRARVMSVAWSPDGRTILTGSKDGTARLWDATTGALLRTVPAHPNWVLSVTFSPDGLRFATGSRDTSACIWETASGRQQLVLSGHFDWVQQVAFSPNGRIVATCAKDGSARIWDAETGRELRNEGFHGNGLSSIAFSPDGTRLATAGGGSGAHSPWNLDPVAMLRDVHTGQTLLRLVAHSNAVLTVAFSPDGRRLATGGADNTIRIREAFPWRSEDYQAAAPETTNLSQQVEAFKRRYWQERLASAAWVMAAGEKSVQPGRRVATTIAGEINLPDGLPAAKLPAMPIPPRMPGTDTNLIDLSACYNAALEETWQPCSGLFDLDFNLSNLPATITNLGGICFDVRGIVRLGPVGANSGAFPPRVEIPIARRFQRLHVLHALEERFPEGRRVGAYRLHYAGGGSAELPIRYGQDARDWQAQPEPAGAEVAWCGSTEWVFPGGAQLCLYRRTYDNPSPAREVVHISFESELETTGPFLVAMTVE